MNMEGRGPLMERWCTPGGVTCHMGFFHMGQAREFNLDHLFVILKSRGCSDFTLAMEIHIE